MERLHISTNIEARPVMRALHVALTRDDWGAEWAYPFTARTLCAQMERDCEITVKTSGRFDRRIVWSDVEEGLGELARDYPGHFARIVARKRGSLRTRVYFKACVLLLELAVYGYTMSEDMEEE